MPELINWYLQKIESSPVEYRINGNVYGSAKFEDGLFIHTSTIMAVNKKGKVLEIRTRNSLYSCSLATHILDKESEEETKRGLLAYGFGRAEANTLMKGMWDAYFPLDEEKKALLSALIPEDTAVCNILEFSSEEEHYFRFLARKDPSGMRFWNEASLHITVSMQQDMAEIRNDELEEKGILFRFYPYEEKMLRLAEGFDNYGAVYVRNGGLEPLTIEANRSRFVVAPGEYAAIFAGES